MRERYKLQITTHDEYWENNKLKALVTAGPTNEYIDPVRFITNKSSGKQGYEIAKSLSKKGFEVPIADWLRNDLKNMVEDSSSKKTLEKMGIINHTLVDDWKQGLYSGKRDTSWQLWTLISYKQWLEKKGKF